MKKILFELVSHFEHSDIPKSAKRYIPEWYKNAETLMGGKLINSKGKNTKTIKACVPFLDSLMSGYIYESPMDIYINLDENGYPVIKWALDNIELMASRTIEVMQKFPPPEGFFPEPITFRHPLYIKTPPGYSVLITSPLNRFDLPFLFLSGIVDTDTHPLFPGNYPFYIKKGFTGLIPKGTPLFQIIPFKRENWDSERSKKIVKEGDSWYYTSGTHFLGWYRKFVWKKKKYD